MMEWSEVMESRLRMEKTVVKWSSAKESLVKEGKVREELWFGEGEE